MDFIALAGVNGFLRRNKKLRWLWLMSLLFSVISLILIIVIPNSYIRLLVLHFILNTGMVCLAFGPSTKKEFLENWALMYFTIILLGGIMEWEQHSGWSDNFFAQAFFAAVLLSVANLYGARRRQFGNQIYPVTVEKGNVSIEMKAYWDSGNQLKDPYSGRPVNILNGKLAKDLVNLEQEGIRYIPYCSLGKKDGLLPVFQVDHLHINTGRKNIDMKPALLGIASPALLEHKEYDMILHAAALE